MIGSFKDAAAEELYYTGKHRSYVNIRAVALRKLEQLANVTRLSELADPPGNHLEALAGSREGQHSIRINDQYRICFEWRKDVAYSVEIVDYH